jgi:hypothetical protein
MFAIVELKTAVLDVGIPGFSQVQVLLVFGGLLALSMIPYFFLYRSLADEDGGANVAAKAAPSGNRFGKVLERIHAHRHAELLHH